MNWPFRRKAQNQTSVPLEVQEYYQTERRERTGVAWLLALGTLIITVFLALLLFFGGRWLYRAVTNDDTSTGNTSQVEQGTGSLDSATNSPESSTGGSANTGTSSTNTNQSTQGQPTTEPAPTTPTPTNSATAPTPVSNQSGSTTTDLPNTGPSEIIGIIAATVIAATCAHRITFGKRQES